MSDKQLILLAAGFAGLAVYLNNIFEIKYFEKRSILLMTHSDDIFLDSEKLEEYREKLNSNLSLDHQDNRILEQIELFKKNYTKEELLIMRNNLQHLKIDPNGSSLFLGGSYSQFDNKISLNPLYDTSLDSSEYRKTLNHEMHHMASNLGRIGNYIASGFEQLKIGNFISHIGKGLNEAYAEYLSKDNFIDEEYMYKKNVDLIPLLELFYDDKKELRQSYFNADLPSVIKRLSEVADRNSIIQLIRSIDKLWIYDSNKTWFDKSTELEIDIRVKLYDFYKKLSGYQNKEELFFTDDMLEKINSKTKRYY